MAARPPLILTLDEVADGLHACVGNIESLMDDADLLLEAQRFPRALSVLLIAAQEAGKTSILLSMAGTRPEDQEHWSRLWKSYRSHAHKAAMRMIGTLPVGLTDAELAVAVLVTEDSGRADERARQRTLYIDLDREKRIWLTPDDVRESDVTMVRGQLAAMVTKLLSQRDRRLFSAEALRIRHEVFSAPEEAVPYEGRPAIAVALELGAQARARYQLLGRRLREAGFDVRLADEQVDNP